METNKTTELNELSSSWPETEEAVRKIIREAYLAVDKKAVAKSGVDLGQQNSSAEVEVLTSVKFKKEIGQLVGNSSNDFENVDALWKCSVGGKGIIEMTSWDFSSSLQAIFYTGASRAVDRLDHNNDEPAFWTPWIAKVVLTPEDGGSKLLRFLTKAQLTFICPLEPGNPVGEITKKKDHVELSFKGETFSQCCRPLGIFREASLVLQFHIPWRIFLAYFLESELPILIRKKYVGKDQKDIVGAKQQMMTAEPGTAEFVAKDGSELRSFFIKKELVNTIWAGCGGPKYMPPKIDVNDLQAPELQIALLALVTGRVPILQNPAQLFTLYRRVLSRGQELNLRFLETFCEIKCLHLIVSSNDDDWTACGYKIAIKSGICEDVLVLLDQDTDACGGSLKPRFKFHLTDYGGRPPVLYDGHLSVKTLTGICLTIPFQSQMTTFDLKLRIHDIQGIPPDQPHLVFDGREMQDDRALYHYNIQDGSTITLVLFLRGC